MISSLPLSPAPAPAAPPLLRPAVAVQCNGAPLDPGSHAIPCVSDWNGDGLNDLLVGFRNDDNIMLYVNSGTPAQPVFTSGVRLQAGGVDIYVAGSGCGAPAPWVCDYDADGCRDLLVGAGASGSVRFYRNTNTDAAPVLAAGILLSPNVVFRATPYVHDWDEDGLQDLLCGEGYGQVYLFRNVGTAQSPAYEAGTLLRVAGSGAPVDFGDRSAVRVFDWDGDGRKDLVGSGSYNASWCRNIGANSAPELEAPVALCCPAPGNGSAPINTSYRMRLELADWNQDGMMDLLIGDYTGAVFLYTGYRFEITSLTPLPGGNWVIRWNSADYLQYNVWRSSSLGCVCGLAAADLPSQGITTAWTNAAASAPDFFRIELAP